MRVPIALLLSLLALAVSGKVIYLKGQLVVNSGNYKVVHHESLRLDEFYSLLVAIDESNKKCFVTTCDETLDEAYTNYDTVAIDAAVGDFIASIETNSYSEMSAQTQKEYEDPYLDKQCKGYTIYEEES